ncbi:transcription elongation factor A N-terminal and central domain-containing protein 2-like [Argonauta hians]
MDVKNLLLQSTHILIYLSSGLSFQRVVSTGEIASIKERLCVKQQNATVILECLQILSEKIPSRKILIDSKIGHIVKRLRSHDDTNVRKMSQKVCKQWNDFFKIQDSLVPVEVKYDLSTTKKRETARKFYAECLGVESNSKLVCDLESAVFYQCKRMIGHRYHKISRKIVFALKSDDMQRNLLSGTISPNELVKEITEKLPPV